MSKQVTLEVTLAEARVEVKRLENALARNRYHYAQGPLAEALDEAREYMRWLEQQVAEQPVSAGNEKEGF